MDETLAIKFHKKLFKVRLHNLGLFLDVPPCGGAPAGSCPSARCPRRLLSRPEKAVSKDDGGFCRPFDTRL